MLVDLEGRQASLKVTLTRISGAIKFLKNCSGIPSDAETAKSAEDGRPE